MHSHFPNIIAALEDEIEALRNRAARARFILKHGVRGEATATGVLYAFLAPEKAQLRDDAPIRVRVGGKEVEGDIASVQEGHIILCLKEDLGASIARAEVWIEEWKLVERLKTQFERVQLGEIPFTPRFAGYVLSTAGSTIGEVGVSDALDDGLNERQRLALRRSLASDLLYVWGPPGTGKTSTISAIVACLSRMGRTILLVSNTNIAVDTALERIGDRMNAEEDFIDGRVLRFGNVVKPELLAKYEEFVTADGVVKRKSRAIMLRLDELRAEAQLVQSDLDECSEWISLYERFIKAEALYNEKAQESRRAVSACAAGL